MSTLPNERTVQVQATAARFNANLLIVSLSDGREISVPLERVPWLAWLANASSEQRARWSIEPGGFAIYWETLDNGFEIEHLMAMQSLAK